MKIAEAFVEIRIDRKKAEGDAKTAAQGALSAMRNVFAAGIVIKGLNESVQNASNLNETISKTKVIFGDSQRAIEDWSKNSAKSMGISQRAALDAASTFATFGQAAGLAGKDLTGFSQDLVGLSSDLASFYNTSPEQAIEAIGAALRGESEPIRQYGVLLDDATLKQRAMTMGIYDGTGVLSQQQRVLAAQAEIMAQTGKAQGDFARTADGVANSQRIAAAEAENASASFGQVLLPVYDKALEVVTFLVNAFASLPAPLQTATVALAGLVAFSGPLGTVKDLVTDLVSSFTAAGVSASTMGLALGAAGIVIAGAVAGFIDYNKRKQEAKRVTDQFVGALKAEAAGQEDATRAAIAANIANDDALDIRDKLGLSAQDLAAIIQGRAVPAFEDFRTAADEAFAENDFEALERLADQFGVNTADLAEFVQAVGRYQTAMGNANAIVTEQTEVERALAAEQRYGSDITDRKANVTQDLADATDAAVGPTLDLEDAARDQADAFKEATARAREEQEALQDLYDTILGQIDAQRAYERAQDDSEQAVRDFNETLTDGQSSLEDIDDAARDAADTIIDTARAFAESKGASLDSQAGINAMIESLYTQAGALDPNSPLRQRLLEYIAELQSIPATIDTSIRLSVTGQTININPSRAGDIIGVRSLPGVAVASAEGRYVPAGANLLSTFGEAGPEAILPLDRPNRLVELLSDPRIGAPIADALGVTGGGSGGGGSSGVQQHNSFTVNAYGDRSFVQWVREQIRQIERESK